MKQIGVDPMGEIASYADVQELSSIDDRLEHPLDKASSHTA
jgi:hypothetical protein